MREISFGAKDIETGEWQYGYLMRGYNDDSRMIQEFNKRCHIVDPNL